MWWARIFNGAHFVLSAIQFSCVKILWKTSNFRVIIGLKDIFPASKKCLQSSNELDVATYRLLYQRG